MFNDSGLQTSNVLTPWSVDKDRTQRVPACIPVQGRTHRVRSWTTQGSQAAEAFHSRPLSARCIYANILYSPALLIPRLSTFPESSSLPFPTIPNHCYTSHSTSTSCNTRLSTHSHHFQKEPLITSSSPTNRKIPFSTCLHKDLRSAISLSRSEDACIPYIAKLPSPCATHRPGVSMRTPYPHQCAPKCSK